MFVVSDKEARKGFSALMNRVCEDHAPLIISRQNKRPVVLMSLEDYNAIVETLYLMKSPANAARLAKALLSVKNKFLLDKSQP